MNRSVIDDRGVLNWWYSLGIGFAFKHWVRVPRSSTTGRTPPSASRTRTVLALIKGHIDKASDAKVVALRRSDGSIICGSVNVKGKDGRHLGERGFVADVAQLTFGRVPEGVELLGPHAADFQDKEQIRQLYFEKCLD